MRSGSSGNTSSFTMAIRDGSAFPVTLDDARSAIELITAMFHSDETGLVVPLPIRPGHPKYIGWTPEALAVAAAAASHPVPAMHPGALR